MDMNESKVTFDNFSDQQLARAIELMISPDDLMSRSVMTSILSTFGFSPDEVREQLLENVPLNDGQSVSWSF